MNMFIIFRSYPPFMKLLVVVFIALISLLAFTLLGSAIGVLFLGVELNSILNEGLQPGNELAFIRLMQIMQSISLFIVPALISGQLFLRKPGDTLGLHTGRIPTVAAAMGTVLLAFSVMPLVNVIAEWNMQMHLPDSMAGLETRLRAMEDRAAELIETLLSTASWQGLAINLLMIAILPAVGEEFMFRGVLQPLLFQTTKNKHAAVIITAFLFSFLHFQFYGFLPRFLLGLLFGYLLTFTQTLWVPILAHFTNNATAVIFYFLLQRDLVSPGLDQVGTSGHSLLALAPALLFSTAALFYLRQTGRHGKASVPLKQK